MLPSKKKKVAVKAGEERKKEVEKKGNIPFPTGAELDPEKAEGGLSSKSS